MIARNSALLVVALAIVSPCYLSGQAASARDAFWSASDLITVAPNPAAHKQNASHSVSRRNAPGDGSGATDPSHGGKPARGNAEVAQLVMDNGYGAAPRLVKSAENRLGLRCSIMLRNANNDYTEVTPGSVFHSGDHIRLSFLANEPGYFYVIQQGSTGSWSPIFPPSNAGLDANKILAGQPQVVPSGSRAFQFDQNPGNEKLYIILSRTPIADIDRAIKNLKTGAPVQPEKPAPGDGGAVLEAVNSIPDVFVQRLASRDLSLVEEQKVNEPTKSDVQGEKAIYVVAKGSVPSAHDQVVLNLELRHE